MSTQPYSLYSAAWRRARGLAGAILLLSLACDKDSTGPTPVPLATKSVVTVSRDTLISGTLADIVLESRDKQGARVWAGGHTVVFAASGGGSAGTLGPVTDVGDGTYTATFTGLDAGSATTITATLDGQPVTQPLPTITVVPGPFAIGSTVMSVVPATILVGGRATLELITRDLAGNPLGRGGSRVRFTIAGGTSTGTLGPVTDHNNGRYTAPFTAGSIGTPLTFGATVDQATVTGALPILTVAHGVSAALSYVQLSSDSITIGDGLQATLHVLDSLGVPRTSGGETVRFQVVAAAGTGTGTMDSTVDHGDGSYTAQFTSTAAGTPVAIGATLNGVAVGGPYPTVTIRPLPAAPQQSTVTVGHDTVAAGTSTTLTALVVDQAGTPITSGVTVTFALASGGTSAGSIGPATLQPGGGYAATFTGLRAGTPAQVSARINDSSAIEMLDTAGVSHLPYITVVAGPFAPDSSTLTLAARTLTLGDSAILWLATRDSLGNTLGQGGRAVVFGRRGRPGASVGIIRGFVDHQDGRYSAWYVADSAGAADTVTASVDGTPLTSGQPAVTVICSAGAPSPATSVVTVNDTSAAHRPVAHATLPSGITTTITLLARDARGCPVPAPHAVSFAATGGSSTGRLGGTVDQGDGAYTATFTGLVAGTALTIEAALDGVPVLSTAAITVVPGDISPRTSLIAIARAEVDSGAFAVVTLTAHDSAGNRLVTGGRGIWFQVRGAPAHGHVGLTIDHQDGSYTTSYAADQVAPGLPDTITAAIEGTPVITPPPTVTVVAGTIAASQSLVTVSGGTLVAGDSVLVTLIGKDAAGRTLVTGQRPALIVFTQAGKSAGIFRPVTNADDGSYRAWFLGRVAGAPAIIGATIDGVVVSTPLPTVTVVPGAASIGTSVVTVATGTLASGDTTTVTLELFDLFGNVVPDPGRAVEFTVAPPALGTVGPAVYQSGNRYVATFTAGTAGTGVLSALLDGLALLTAPAGVVVN
ncbi:MAG: hypothetical protein KBF47_13625 [Gemmatimonadales bacterium]|nr:hypothetical protein [Gemmatimonadales bacterium]